MKTVADFKRKAILGSTWKCIMEMGKFIGYEDETGIAKFEKLEKEREVSVVQSNMIAFKTQKDEGVFVNSWIEYPKAKNVKFPNENTMEVYEENKLLLTYIFIK